MTDGGCGRSEHTGVNEGGGREGEGVRMRGGEREGVREGGKERGRESEGGKEGGR